MTHAGPSRQQIILTPVPLEHLGSGLEVCTWEGQVAYGSAAYEFFESLFEHGEGPGSEVLLYASHSPGPVNRSATWAGTYVAYRRAEDMPERERKRFRPESCRKEDAVSPWPGFYLLQGLTQLSEPIPLSSLRRRGGRRFAAAFVPEGPQLAER